MNINVAQVPRILAPLVEVIDAIESPTSPFATNPAIQKYVISQFGSLHKYVLPLSRSLSCSPPLVFK